MKVATTSQRLKQIISERHIRQIDIIEAAKPFSEKYGVKLNKNDLSQYVNGKTEPGQEKLSILGLTLNVNEAWLMGYDVPMERVSSEELQPPEAKKESAPAQSEADLVEEMVKQLTNKLLQLDDARLLELNDYLSYLEWKMQKERREK